jgi:hypothetical protein
MARSLPDLPLFLLHLATAEGLEIDYCPGELETLIIDTARAHPIIRAMQVLHGRFDLEPREILIRRTGPTDWRPIEPGELAQAELRLGPATTGSILFVNVREGALPPGPPAGPAVCGAFAMADQLWDLGIGDLSPAPEVKPDSA